MNFWWLKLSESKNSCNEFPEFYISITMVISDIEILLSNNLKIKKKKKIYTKDGVHRGKKADNILEKPL